MNKLLSKKVIRYLTLALALGVALYNSINDPDRDSSDRSTPPSLDNEQVYAAYENRQSDVQVRGSGKVVKVLADDTKGSRHQKMILSGPSGLRLLIAHNIDLAPRIENLREGDTVEYYGEYEWNQKGGVIHWTHHDPGGRHIDGWLKHRGKTYQ